MPRWLFKAGTGAEARSAIAACASEEQDLKEHRKIQNAKHRRVILTKRGERSPVMRRGERRPNKKHRWRTVRLSGSLTSLLRCCFCDCSTVPKEDGSQCPNCSRRIDAFLRDVEHLYERYAHGLTAQIVPPHWCDGAIGTAKNYLVHSYAFFRTHHASFFDWRLTRSAAWVCIHINDVEKSVKYVKKQVVSKDNWCKVCISLLVAVANECRPRHEIIENNEMTCCIIRPCSSAHLPYYRQCKVSVPKQQGIAFLTTRHGMRCQRIDSASQDFNFKSCKTRSKMKQTCSVKHHQNWLYPDRISIYLNNIIYNYI